MNGKLGKFINACRGMTESQGGLNLRDFKKMYKKYFPKDAKIVDKLSRKELEIFCADRIQYPKNKERNSYFIARAPLTDDQKRYCKCLAHVAAKNPPDCNIKRDWKNYHKGCYNPYAVCTASTKRSGFVDCFSYYNLENIPEDEVEALRNIGPRKFYDTANRYLRKSNKK